MTDYFTPRGDVAEWRLIYDAARQLDTGDTLTYEDLDALLGRDLKGDRNPIYRAMRELETADQRTLTCVTNVGYRVAAANEHEGLAKHHHKKSRRQIRKAVSKAASANRADLTQDERQRIDAMEMTLRRHADMIRRLDVRDQERAAEIRQLRREKNEDVAELSDKVDRLTDLLARHGISAVKSA